MGFTQMQLEQLANADTQYYYMLAALMISFLINFGLCMKLLEKEKEKEK
jgi:hypothetical protein